MLTNPNCYKYHTVNYKQQMNKPNKPANAERGLCCKLLTSKGCVWLQ